MPLVRHILVWLAAAATAFAPFTQRDCVCQAAHVAGIAELQGECDCCHKATSSCCETAASEPRGCCDVAPAVSSVDVAASNGECGHACACRHFQLPATPAAPTTGVDRGDLDAPSLDVATSLHAATRSPIADTADVGPREWLASSAADVCADLARFTL